MLCTDDNNTCMHADIREPYTLFSVVLIMYSSWLKEQPRTKEETREKDYNELTLRLPDSCRPSSFSLVSILGERAQPLQPLKNCPPKNTSSSYTHPSSDTPVFALFLA